MKEQTLSDKIDSRDIENYIGEYCYKACSFKKDIIKDVKEFIKKDTELIDDLQEQLLIDFATPLSIKSANRIIKARIKANQEKRIKLAGPKLVEQTQTKEVEK